ncbi:MAG: ABC transporter substrate-binding protein [Schwartzia sp.]|nr:ABC transporter substrate-binding protein [Schwartzia sp. (in: firmicutes)]
MKKIAALLLLVTFLITGCGASNSEKKADTRSQSKKQIVIGLMPDTDSIPFIIAEKNGYFKEEGVEVTLMPFKSAMDRDAAMQSGNLDGAVSDLLAVAFAKSGGFDVCVTSMTDGNYRLVAGKSVDLANGVSALKGKDVAVSKNTIIEYVTDQILAKNNMPDTDIEKVVIPQIPLRLEMLQNGKLAAATLPEPMASIAIFHGCKFVTDSAELGINPGVMMFTKTAVKDKNSEIAAVYRAYNKAVDYLASTDREKYIDFIIEKNGFPSEAKNALKLPAYHKAELPKEKDISECMDWLYSKKLVSDKYSYQDLVVKGLF